MVAGGIIASLYIARRGACNGRLPGGNGKSAFASDRDGNNEIYMMNANGTGQTRLTNNSASDSDPAWSADGTKIAFVSNRDGNFEIYKMNADGTGQTGVTTDAAFDADPGLVTRRHADRVHVQSRRPEPHLQDERGRHWGCAAHLRLLEWVSRLVPG